MVVARALKAVRETTRCYAVGPQGSLPRARCFVDKPRHVIHGIRYGTVPRQWEPNLCNGTMAVCDEEAESWRVRLDCEEGLYVGYSDAANVCAASRLLVSGILGSNAVVATILCDTGLKY
jgi:cysteine synthase A